MKIFFLIVAIFSTSSCQQYIPYSNKSTNTHNTNKIIVSRFSTGIVTLKEANLELDKFIAKDPNLKGITFDNLSKDQQEIIIKEVIVNKLSVAEARKRNLDKEDNYVQAVDIFTTELLKQKLISNLSNKVRNEEYVKKKYNELAEELKTKKDIKIRYIALKEEKDAIKLYKILKENPRIFSSQAKKKSIDKQTAKEGGSLGGFVLRDSLPAPIANYTKNMKKYEISKPIQVGDNWFLVKFEGDRPAKVEPFEKVKVSLAQQLAKKEVNEFVSNLLEQSKIKFFLD
ncbi:MAG: peptidyl-prolyl cis-trans isomerase [Rickettsiales bacterium]|nr:peptidyl-prolyl cis-trans isomerase [Rickettsiales bacterium]